MAYQKDKIDKQMDMSASSFIDSDNVIIDQAKSRLQLSKIFDWYGKDFGNKAQLIRFLATYRHDPNEQTWRREQGARLSVSWLDYNWGLNT